MFVFIIGRSSERKPNERKDHDFGAFLAIPRK